MVFPWEHVPVTVYFSFIGLGVRSPFDLTSLYKFFCFCWATSLVTLIYNTYLHFDQKKERALSQGSLFSLAAAVCNGFAGLQPVLQACLALFDLYTSYI
jgi:hypothetical protein